jgi:thymidine kinase
VKEVESDLKKNRGKGKEMSGSIEVIVGSMFSGKTTELQRRVRRHRIAGRKCVMIKFGDDVRYDAASVCSHDQVKSPAIPTHHLHDVDITGYDVVGIDEAQFFDDLVEWCEMVANSGKIVIAAGCDGTYQKKPFGRILELIPCAEHVTKLSAVCTFCHKDASFTHCKHPDGSAVQIGGAELYTALCRACFLAPNREKI